MYNKNTLKEVRPIVSKHKTYEDLQQMFGPYYPMPPATVLAEEEIEYRCPYISRCETGANCFAVATPEPLQDSDILNVKCRLLGGKKLPVYARAARVRK